MNLSTNDILAALLVTAVLFIFARDCAFEAARAPGDPTGAATRGRSP